MPQVIKQKQFRELPAAYFHEKAKQVNGPKRLRVMLEMNKYIRDALQNGLSFEQLKELGFRFATV